MELPLAIALESHPHGATLYLTGALTAAGLARVAELCDGLPESVCILRVSARNLGPGDPHVVTALAATLRGWGCRHQQVARPGRSPRDRRS